MAIQNKNHKLLQTTEFEPYFLLTSRKQIHDGYELSNFNRILLPSTLMRLIYNLHNETSFNNEIIFLKGFEKKVDSCNIKNFIHQNKSRTTFLIFVGRSIFSNFYGTLLYFEYLCSRYKLILICGANG